MTLAASTSTDKSLKDFDELMSTPIDFSRYILNGLKIENLTQEILLGPAFRLLKGTRSNYAELEYDFEECYKALSEKLDWENPKGGDYPFDLSKPLPLIKHGKRIEDMVPNIWSPVKVAYDRYVLWGISHWRQQQVRCDDNRTMEQLLGTHPPRDFIELCLAGGNFLDKVPRECLIKSSRSKSKVRQSRIKDVVAKYAAQLFHHQAVASDVDELKDMVFGH
ncbi:hypothetical protein Tco_0551919 [Tanacetum coccineum]